MRKPSWGGGGSQRRININKLNEPTQFLQIGQTVEMHVVYHEHHSRNKMGTNHSWDNQHTSIEFQ